MQPHSSPSCASLSTSTSWIASNHRRCRNITTKVLLSLQLLKSNELFLRDLLYNFLWMNIENKKILNWWENFWNFLSSNWAWLLSLLTANCRKFRNLSHFSLEVFYCILIATQINLCALLRLLDLLVGKRCIRVCIFDYPYRSCNICTVPIHQDQCRKVLMRLKLKDLEQFAGVKFRFFLLVAITSGISFHPKKMFFKIDYSDYFNYLYLSSKVLWSFVLLI